MGQSTESCEAAWKRLMGSTFDRSKESCRWFMTGWNAARGLS